MKEKLQKLNFQSSPILVYDEKSYLIFEFTNEWLAPCVIILWVSDIVIVYLSERQSYYSIILIVLLKLVLRSLLLIYVSPLQLRNESPLELIKPNKNRLFHKVLLHFPFHTINLGLIILTYNRSLIQLRRSKVWLSLYLNLLFSHSSHSCTAIHTT